MPCMRTMVMVKVCTVVRHSCCVLTRFRVLLFVGSLVVAPVLVSA